MGQSNEAPLLRSAIARAAAELPRLALSDQTTRATALAWDRFAAFAVNGYDARCVDDLDAEIVHAFVHARHGGGTTPSVAAVHWRRSALRLLFRTWRELGLTDGDPTLDLRLPQRSSLVTRPLNDDEVALCRWASLSTASETRLPALWALAEAGATSSEVALVRVIDVDATAGTVRLLGSTKTDARIASLTSWGLTQVRRRIEILGREPFTRLVYEGSGQPQSAQASVSGAIGDVLHRAGLADEPDVRPRSVTAWAGRTVFDETGRIEDVARRLGMRSLDRARRVDRLAMAHAMKPARGVSSLEQVEAILRNDAIYELAELITEPARERGGRHTKYPAFMLIAYEALISVFRSARRVEAEIAHPVVWDLMRRIVRERHPRNMRHWLPAEPMRRHHYLYGREQVLLPIREQLRDRFEQIATRQAVTDLGLCDPDGPGSVTHPDLSRMLYADGKVVTPLWKAKPGDTRIDARTGEIRPLRVEADAALHVTGSGEPAWGTKHVMVAVRSSNIHGRMILSIAPVPDVGGEAAVALACVGRLAPLLPGALGVIYDGAFRGVHLVELLRERGLLPIVPVQAASGGRHAKKPRVERTVLVGPGTIRRPDNSTSDCILYAEAGALCLAELDATGEVTLIRLERTKTEPRRNADRSWRWYGVYTVPDDVGGGTIRVRLDTTDEDRRRKFNRAEHLRAIPPSDPDYQPLYARRADAESINRALDDTSWLGRAHSAGRDRQLLNLIGYAIAVNSLALHRYRRVAAPPGQLVA